MLIKEIQLANQRTKGTKLPVRQFWVRVTWLSFVLIPALAWAANTGLSAYFDCFYLFDLVPGHAGSLTCNVTEDVYGWLSSTIHWLENIQSFSTFFLLPLGSILLILDLVIMKRLGTR